MSEHIIGIQNDYEGFLMRVTNLILHLLSSLLMIPDAFFIGIAFLWGIQYLSGMEVIVVPLFVLLFFAGFILSSLGGLIQFAGYKKLSSKAYMKRELIFHGLAALSFGLMIGYTLMIILNPAPKIPELSTDSSDTHISVIDMAGFVVAVAGMIFNVIGGIIRNKKAAKIVKPQAVTPGVSRPKFCPQCGNPAGVTGDFCGKCGSKLV